VLARTVRVEVAQALYLHSHGALTEFLAGEVHLPPPVTTGKSAFEIDDPQCSGGLREYCLDATTRCICNFEGNGEAICTPVARCEPSPHYEGKLLMHLQVFTLVPMLTRVLLSSRRSTEGGDTTKI